MFQLTGQEQFLTTVGKLNFFRWAIEKGVLDYIKTNLAKIEKEMNTNAREIQKIRKQTNSTETSTGTAATATSTKSSTTRRRTRLMLGGAAATKTIEKHELQVSVSFD
jgi:hypothetical protein